MLRPLLRRCSSVASLTRCASPPESVVARLAEPHVAQSHVDERLHVPVDRLDRLEELRRLLDRHLQDLGDVLALVVHRQGVPVVALAVADLAVDVHVRQEVHLDLDRAVARARLAASAFDVEAEPARLVAAHLGLRRLAEQRTDPVEHSGVGGRVRPRGAPDRCLIDVHDLVEVVEAGHPDVLARHGARPVQPRGEHPVQDVVHEGGLAGSADAGDRREHAERELRRDVLQVVLLGADDAQHPLPVDPAALLRRDDLATARQIVARHRRLLAQQRLVRTGVHDETAVHARAGADVDHPVRRLDRLLVVLHDDQRVAQVAQGEQGLDEPAVVALVQADGRLVEHVQHAGEPRSDLRRQPDALRLPAGQRSGGAAEVQVRQARPAAGSRAAAGSRGALELRSSPRAG